MTMPKFTKRSKSEAEQVIEEKVTAYAKKAETAEEILESQRMLENQEKIQNGKKKTILGLSPETLFTGVVSLVQIGAILKAEDIRAVTSKALGFVHKGRLR